MNYVGTLTLPNNYVLMNEEEIMYLEGGATYDMYKTASAGCTYLSAMAVAFAAEAVGCGAVAAAGAATVIVGILGGAGAALCGLMASSYTGAYNDCSDIKADYGSSKRVRIRETVMAGVFISNVSCKVA